VARREDGAEEDDGEERHEDKNNLFAVHNDCVFQSG
jgi:hypothetical protein